MATAMLSSSSIEGDDVRNSSGDDLGTISDLMIDLTDGSVRYAVLSFGGVLGLGDKLFAVPFEAFTADLENECFVLDVSHERLDDAPGFDKDEWPNFADKSFTDPIDAYYRAN